MATEADTCTNRVQSQGLDRLLVGSHRAGSGSGAVSGTHAAHITGRVSVG